MEESGRHSRAFIGPNGTALQERALHWSNDALLEEDPRLRGRLEGFLGSPLGSHGDPEGAFVLLSILKGMGQGRCKIFGILTGATELAARSLRSMTMMSIPF